MGDQEETCGELVGVKVNEMAVKCGGRQWALKTYGEHAETAIVVGEIINWQQGTRAAFDKYIVEWDDGDEEVVTLDQVRRIMQTNPGTAVTALPSSVRLLTAASCCSWNHLPARGGHCGGSCRGGCVGGGGPSRAGRWTVGGRRRRCANPPPDHPHPPPTSSFSHIRTPSRSHTHTTSEVP
jgi:hypothetical protein